MGPISRWAVRRPWQALAAWVAMAITIGALAVGLGGVYNNTFELPDTESAEAQDLLLQIPGAGDALTVATAKVVWRPDDGAATDPGVEQTMTEALTQIAGIGSVACVVHPYGAPLGTQCPEAPASAGSEASAAGDQDQGGQAPGEGATAPPDPEQAKVLAGLGSAGFSVDGSIGFATVSFSEDAEDVPGEDATAVLDAVAAANAADGLLVGANGQVLEFAGVEPPSSEGIGVTIALVILLFAFGSLVGAFLPIGTALLSLGVGQALVLLTARFLDVATFAPTLAAMIGLGVGIDYSLFVINRYKQALDVGRDPKDAAMETVRTAGRAVVFAAATVVIALSGLFVIGFEFFNGLAVAAAATVVMMMVGATLLLPAVLSLLGRRAFAVRMPWARRPKPHNPEGAAFARYGRWLERNFRVAGALALLLMLVIAIPVGSLRLGFPDDSGKPADHPARVAYDLVSEGFGPGVNGPFIVAVQTGTPGDNAAVGQLAGALSADEGVAVAAPYPLTEDASITAVQVIPTTSPQDEATEQLLDRLRDEVIPSVEESVDLVAPVGGTLAITSDFTTVLVNALPLFLLVVVGFGFLVLVLLFRSVLVPATGVATSLLSLAAAMGVTVAVFQWGWTADLVGISGTGPIVPFLPIMVFAILFGLSMDYQVFLVSRMQEEWGHTADNRKAVRRGLAASGRVVAIAAAIMYSVFGAFVLGNDSTIKLFGLALSSAVLFDAFVVRLIIVPSVMYQLGRANWWLPGWLGRVLPAVSVESEEDIALAEAEIADIPDELDTAR